MTDAPASDAFPSDLLAAQKLLSELYAQIAAFPKARGLPWSVEPLDGWADEKSAHGGTVAKRGRPASPGWCDDDKTAYAELWRKLQETAAFVQGHRYWAAVKGPDLVRRRMQLKHDPAALPTPVEPAVVDADTPAAEDLAQAV